MKEIIKRHLVTVRTEADVKEMFDHITAAEYLAYDVESTGVNVRKDIIVGLSVTGEAGYGYYLPIYSWNKDTQYLDKLTITLSDGTECDTSIVASNIVNKLHGKKLIMHNGAFDIAITLNDLGIDLVDSLWVDTIMLVHTVSEDGVGHDDAHDIEKNFRLKDIAVAIQDELGFDMMVAANAEQIAMKESITANGGRTTKTNYEMYKADMELLAEYGAADTDLTFRICFHYLQVLEDEGLTKFFFEEEVMPLYREVTIMMERVGIKLDIPFMHKIDKEIIEELAVRKDIVMNSLLEDPDALRWLTDACVDTYPAKHRGKWGLKLCELSNIEVPLSDSGKPSLNNKFVETLPDSPVKSFLTTNDPSVLPSSLIQEVMVSMWRDANDGELFNIQSKKIMGEIVFDYKELEPLSKTRKGQPQFNEDMIKALSADYKWANDLRVYNKLMKVKSTYVDRFLELSEDGIFYPYFKQHGTVSGRYGSNLQQLPKPLEEGDDDDIIVYYKNTVRKFFIPREGMIFIDADYESLEPHCFASISKDEVLRDIFRNGWDFYSTVAIKTEGLQGVSPDKKADNYLKKVNPNKRNQAKSYSLGIAYGMEDFALSMTLGIPQKEAKVLVNGYLNGFPGLKAWRESSRALVKETGRITNKVGRIRHLPKVKQIHEAFGDQILDWRFRKRLGDEIGSHTTAKQVYRDYKNGLNNALNYQLQSLAAAVVNRAAIEINRELKKRQIPGLVIAQIHDQLIMEVPIDRGEECLSFIQPLMETTTELEGVTLKAPPELAINFYEGH